MVERGFIKRLNNISRYRSSLIFEPKKEKNFSFSWKSFRYFLVVVIAISFVYFIFYSREFQINDIIIEGNRLVKSEQIIHEVPKGNIFRLNVTDFKTKILQDFPEISGVEVYRGIPNALKIVVSERNGEMVWQSGANKYLISSQGEVMRLVAGGEGDKLPVVIDKKDLAVTPGSAILSPSLIAFVTNIYGGLYDAVNIHPDHFEINETTFDLNLYTDANFYIKLDSLRSSKSQLDNLKLTLAGKRADVHEYVDVRIAGWAYYK